MASSGSVLCRTLWIAGAFCFYSIAAASSVTANIGSAADTVDAIANPSGSTSTTTNTGNGAALAPVGVDHVNLATSSETNAIVGRIIGLQQGAVASQRDGLVRQVHVRVGDAVRKGDLLISLDQARAGSEQALSEATVSQWQARVASHQATLKQAQADAKAAISGIAAVNTEQTKAAVAHASVAESIASLQYAQVEKRIADQAFSNTEIRAPFDGVVTSRSVNVGNWIERGTQVIELVNPSHLEVEAHIPSEQALGLKRDQSLSISVAGSVIPATLRAIVPIENPETKTRLARFAVKTDRSLKLAINQSTTVHIPVNKEKLLSVHKDAVIRSGNMSLVYKVSEGVAVITPVSLGREIGDRFEVQNGLEDGDVVVIRGNRRLRPGQRVMYPGMIQRRQEANTPANF